MVLHHANAQRHEAATADGNEDGDVHAICRVMQLDSSRVEIPTIKLFD